MGGDTVTRYDRLRAAVVEVLDAEVGDDVVALRRLLWDALNQESESESLEAPVPGARGGGEPTAWQALHALYVIAINGRVCTPPDTWADPFAGGDGSGRMFDIEAVKCHECREAWRMVEAVVRSHDAKAIDRLGAELERVAGHSDEATIREALAQAKTCGAQYGLCEECRAELEGAEAALSRLVAALAGCREALAIRDGAPETQAEWWVIRSETHLAPDALASWGPYPTRAAAEKEFARNLADPAFAVVPLRAAVPPETTP